MSSTNKSKAPVLSDSIRFTIEKFTLLFTDGKSVDIMPEHVAGLYIEKDYDNMFLPIFRIDFTADVNTFYKIVMDKTGVQAHIRIDYHPFNQAGKFDKKIRTWFNEKFDVFTEDDTPKLTKENHDQHMEQNRTSEKKEADSSMAKNANISVYLFKTKDVNAAYNMGNFIFTSTNMTDAITFLLSRAGLSNILMSPLENQRTYKEVLVPPSSLVSALEYLNAVYGFYQHGMMFFLDIQRPYLLSKKSDITVWEKGESRRAIFNVRKSDDSDNMQNGSKTVIEENTGYINVSPSKLAMQSPSVFNNYIHGNKIHSINLGQNKSNVLTANTIQRGNPLLGVLVNRYRNPYAESERKYDLEHESRVITMTITESNIHWYTPNKEFIFNFEDKNVNKIYGGKYRLAAARMQFTNTGSYLTNDTSLVYKK